MGGRAQKLGDVRYVYTWDGERVFKIVSFYLVHAARGPARRASCREWRSRSRRPAGSRSTRRRRLLSYGGERQMALAAAGVLAEGSS